MDDKEIIDKAKAVLETNNQGTYTIPANGLYPHQWLWDSCFISIGLRHYEIERAQTELMSLLRGQWANGMLPNIVLSEKHKHIRNGNMWRSWLNPNAPDNVATSGITQPPMLAEAVYRVGQKMILHERREWYNKVFPALLAYHNWLHTERDPHQEGLTIQIHPWETGLDNTPPWMKELKDHQMSTWIRIVEWLHLDWVIGIFRRDTMFIPAEQRLSTIEALSLYSTQRRLRRKSYNIERILSHSLFAIEDLAFNCILIRADKILREIAKTINKDISEELSKQMDKTVESLEQLWDAYTGQYYSRNFVTHKLIKEPTIATLLPLYSGSISKERAEQLVALLKNKHVFGANFPVPSVPLNSPWFNELGYWQGPTWINTNWLIIDGLKQYGFREEAEWLITRTIELVKTSGCFEYFSPIDGQPAGAENFSWTAALTIDLLESQERAKVVPKVIQDSKD